MADFVTLGHKGDGMWRKFLHFGGWQTSFFGYNKKEKRIFWFFGVKCCKIEHFWGIFCILEGGFFMFSLLLALNVLVFLFIVVISIYLWYVKKAINDTFDDIEENLYKLDKLIEKRLSDKLDDN